MYHRIDKHLPDHHTKEVCLPYEVGHRWTEFVVGVHESRTQGITQQYLISEIAQYVKPRGCLCAIGRGGDEALLPQPVPETSPLRPNTNLIKPHFGPIAPASAEETDPQMSRPGWRLYRIRLLYIGAMCITGGQHSCRTQLSSLFPLPEVDSDDTGNIAGNIHPSPDRILQYCFDAFDPLGKCRTILVY